MSDSKGISGFDTNTNDAAPKQRRNRLLLIGIDQYEHWGKLQYPVGDCNQFFGLLKEHYGFGEQDLIQSLYNEQATADIIFDELYRLQEQDEDGKPRLGTDDNLILYFSGHGHLDKSLDEGYWAPVDAPVPVKNRPSDLRKLVSVSEVVKILSQVKAHHILLIVDACFSGAFARMAVEVMPGGDPNNPEEKPSRWVLTAGRLEPVPDKSEFAEALRQVLEANDSPKISIDWVGAEVAKKVRENTRYNPWCGTLVEQRYEGGEFFFHRLTTAQRTDHAPRPASAIAQLPERLRQGSAAHLERLKKGRFKHLNIIQLLLTGNNLPGLIDTQVKSGDTETPLHQAVQSLWGRGKPHAVVLGDGGMGKTVSLVRLWEDMLGQSTIDSQQLAIPVFVALNEYNANPESEKHDFVLRSIARNCGLAEALTDDWKNALWELLKTPLSASGGSPSVLLMLDGFNEVTVKKDQLLIDLNRLSEQAKGMQMVITSRYVEIQNFTWAQHSEVIELLPLPQDKIKEYLQQVHLPLPEDEALQKLFGNPMMLTLYAGASSIAKKYEHDKRFRFLPTGSYGELLWNFNEAQLARHLEDLEHDPDEQAWHCFLLRCLVPRLAYKMELEGQFFVPTRKALNPAFNFKTLLDEAFADLNREELTEVFPELMGKRSLLGLGELSDLDAREQRSQKVLKYLVDKLHLLVAEDEALRFVHQNFRDFFAACHLRNVAEMAIAKKYLPIEWQSKTFASYTRLMLGNISGEHYHNPYKAARHFPISIFNETSVQIRLLDSFRNSYGLEGIQYAVWNILQIIADTRQTFSGINMENLDLSKLYLGGTPLSTKIGKARYLTCKLNGSLIIGKFLFLQGHSFWVTKVRYSSDGKRILCSSDDFTVKEWSVETGACLNTFIGHSSFVNCACYSPDDRFILSASEDRNVRLWSLEKGTFIKNIGKHSSSITDACFSPDGNNVMISFHQNFIEEWSIETGKRIQSFVGHTHSVNCVYYNKDGSKILSGSDDCTIKEWAVKTGACLKTFSGHKSCVNSVVYNSKETMILSASNDKSIKEWSVNSGICNLTIIGHNDKITCAQYSPDDDRILSASYDSTIKEWSTKTGICLRTFNGHTKTVSSVCYSPNGKKIISASHDRSLKEWLSETGDCLHSFEGYFNEVSKSGYSKGGKILLSLSVDSYKVWSSLNGICLQSQNNINTSIWVNKKFVFHPNAEKIIIISEKIGLIEEWSISKNICLSRISIGKPISKVSYVLNNTEVLLQVHEVENHEYYVKNNKLKRKTNIDNFYKSSIQLWSLKDKVCLKKFCDNSTVVDLCCSKDGKKILITKVKVIEEWSIESKSLLQTFIINEQIRNLFYSHDGENFLSISLIRDNSDVNNPILGNITSRKYHTIINHLNRNIVPYVLQIWSIKDGICLIEHRTEFEQYPFDYLPCFSYNDKEILVLVKNPGYTLKRWSVENFSELTTLEGDQARALYEISSGNGRTQSGELYFLTNQKNVVEERSSKKLVSNRLVNEVGLSVQSVDFRHLHPSSQFTEEEKDRLRRYGAIFNDEDERRWKEAVADAYGDLEEDDEPENPPQP